MKTEKIERVLIPIKNNNSSVLCYAKKAKQGDPIAQYHLGHHYANSIQFKDFRKSAEWYLISAKQGNCHAQNNLGMLYAKGQGVRQNDVQAYLWISIAQSAAIEGSKINKHALHSLDILTKRMSAEEIKLAQKLLTQYAPLQIFTKQKQLADHGEPQSQYHLGHIYAKGLGVTIDKEIALYWYKKAAEQGLVIAQHHCALMYQDDKEIKTDLFLAAYWFCAAAIQGHPHSQYHLARLYELGISLPLNEKKALYYYQEAARQNHPLAQLYLGKMYQQGRGTNQNIALAKKWFKHASQHNLPIAQYELGIIYSQENNIYYAYQYLQLARAHLAGQLLFHADTILAKITQKLLFKKPCQAHQSKKHHIHYYC